MKIKVSKEWFAQSAKIEGDSEVGAGISFLREYATKRPKPIPAKRVTPPKGQPVLHAK